MESIKNQRYVKLVGGYVISCGNKKIEICSPK